MSNQKMKEKILDQKVASYADALMGNDGNPFPGEDSRDIRELDLTLKTFHGQVKSLSSSRSEKTRIYKAMRREWSRSINPRPPVSRDHAARGIKPILRGFAWGFAGVMLVIVVLLSLNRMEGIDNSGLLGTAIGNASILPIALVIFGGLVVFLIIFRENK